MPAGPPTADIGPLDFDHLERMTLGEKALEREVLEMFLAQSSRLVATLESLPAETAPALMPVRSTPGSASRHRCRHGIEMTHSKTEKRSA